MFTASDLKCRAEVTINDTAFLVLDDGSFTHVYRDEDVDYSAEYEDYNEFCRAVRAISDKATIAAVAREAGIRGAYTSGACEFVDAAEDGDGEGDPRIDTMTPAQAYEVYVGEQSVAEFAADSDDIGALCERYVEQSPLCAELTEDQREQLSALLVRYVGNQVAA